MSDLDDAKSPETSQTKSLPNDMIIRQAVPNDGLAIHALMRPYVMQRLLLGRTEAEIIELTRHGFVAVKTASGSESQISESQISESQPSESQTKETQTKETQIKETQIIGFSAVEIYSPKLAELMCLAVHHDFQGTGVGKALVSKCVQRAKDLGVMEVMAISSSEDFLRTCGFDYSLPDQKKALFCQLRPRPKD